MTTDIALQRLGGCGPFQVLLLLASYITHAPAIWSTMFMAFGNYNPGWQCLQWGGNASFSDNTSVLVNSTTGVAVPENDGSGNGSASAFQSSSCKAFDACEIHQFTPGTSTIVTEWALLCERNWIVNLITSLQMTGSLVGNFLGGQLSDKFGRKWPVYIALVVHSCINIVAYFGTSWESFAVVRFLLGLVAGTITTICIIFPLEFANDKWRPTMTLLPSWNITTIIFAFMAMILKDYRSLHISFAVVGFVLCLFVFWVPESLRWLVVHDRVDDAHKVTNQVAKWNRRENLDRQTLEAIARSEQENAPKRVYTCAHLFTKTLLKRTLVCSSVYFAMNVMYYAIYFGVRALSGNIYINIMLTQLSPFPLLFAGPFLANIFGRKFASIAFLLCATLCCLGTVLVHFTAGADTAGLATLVLSMIAVAAVTAAWLTINAYVAEMYPTVVRLLAFGFLNTVSRVGAIAAPFLIPQDTGTLYVSSSIMGLLGLICCVSLLTLPETKGKPMSDTIEKISGTAEVEEMAA